MNAPAVDPARLERNWNAITVELDAPVATRLERLVRRIGLPASYTRLVLATPGLRRAWFVALGVVMFVALVSGDAVSGDNVFGFLALAPLIPVLGVAFAYGIEADPAHEIGIATPMRGLTLVLTRAAVILSVSTLLLTLTAVISPGTGLWAVAWILPSVALTFTTLGLSTWFSPRRAASIATGLWLVGLLVVRGAATNELAAFTAPGQLFALLIAGFAAVVMWQRRDRFDVMAVQL